MKINCIGTAVPKRKLSQNEIANICCNASGETPKRSDALRMLFKKAEVETRHTVLTEADLEELLTSEPTGTKKRMQWYEKYAAELSSQAAKDAFRKTTLTPQNVTHLITVSCTGFYAPGIDCNLIEMLSLSPQVLRTHIGYQGCHAVFNALRVAKAFIAEDPLAVVLVVSVELCTLHLNVGKDFENTVANSLFSDGAAAAICTNDKMQSLNMISSGSVLIPNTSDLMSWKIGDLGFHMSLSSKLPEIIINSLSSIIEPWLLTNSCSIKNIKGFAIHPGGPRILSACKEALQLNDESLASSRKILKDYGNMSSATILFVLNEMQRSEIQLPYLALGFGPGITVEFLLFI